MRTLLDNDTSERPQRRTALIASELARYKIDIAALSETRLSEKGELHEKEVTPSIGVSTRWESVVMQVLDLQLDQR